MLIEMKTHLLRLIRTVIIRLFFCRTAGNIRDREMAECRLNNRLHPMRILPATIGKVLSIEMSVRVTNLRFPADSTVWLPHIDARCGDSFKEYHYVTGLGEMFMYFSGCRVANALAFSKSYH